MTKQKKSQMVSLNVLIPEETRRAAKVAAARMGVTLQEWIASTLGAAAQVQS